jgi:HEAT repeat protein
MDKRVQIAALETTGVLQNAEAIPRMSEVLAASKDKDVRRAALTAIAMIADPSSRDLFERFLSDADGAMRAAAAEGLGRLKNPADKPRFEKLFEEERQMNPRLSLALAAVLCGKTELSQFSPLEYLVNTLNSALYRGVAYAFLIEASRDAAIRKSLYPGIAQRTRDEKKSLAMILAHTGDKESEPVLEALSKDPDVEVGQEATRAYRTLKARLPAQ